MLSVRSRRFLRFTTEFVFCDSRLRLIVYRCGEEDADTGSGER